MVKVVAGVALLMLFFGTFAITANAAELKYGVALVTDSQVDLSTLDQNTRDYVEVIPWSQFNPGNISEKGVLFIYSEKDRISRGAVQKLLREGHVVAFVSVRGGEVEINEVKDLFTPNSESGWPNRWKMLAAGYGPQDFIAFWMYQNNKYQARISTFADDQRWRMVAHAIEMLLQI